MTEGLDADRLSPAGIFFRRGLEFSTFKHGGGQRRGGISGKCFVCVLGGFVILSIVVLVFAVTVLRSRRLDVKLKSVDLKNLRYGNSVSPFVNASLVAEMSIKNMNFGYFEFESGVFDVQYGGMSVGKRKIGKGFVNVLETKKMNLTVDLSLKNINLGVLELRSFAKLRGRLCSMKIIQKMKTADMNCRMMLNLTSGMIKDLICK